VVTTALLIIVKRDLEPCNISGLINNLYYLEPGCILLAILLQSTDLYDLVRPHATDIESAAKPGDLSYIPEEIPGILVKLLAVVIGRVSSRNDAKQINPSLDLPGTIVASMRQYNERVKALLLKHLQGLLHREADDRSDDAAGSAVTEDLSTILATMHSI